MEFVCLGMILNPFGIKGEAKIYSYTDFAKKRFKKGQTIKLFNEQNEQKFDVTVQSTREQGKFLIVKFAEFSTPEEVQIYKNFLLMIKNEDIHKLPKNQFYIRDLIGMRVYQGDDYRGEVSAVESNGRQDLIRVKMQGTHDVLIPLVEAWVEKVDEENKKIFIKLIEGLFP